GSAPLSNILHKGRSDSGVSCFLNFILFQEVSFMEDFAPERVCSRCSSRAPATSRCPRRGPPPPPPPPAPPPPPPSPPTPPLPPLRHTPTPLPAGPHLLASRRPFLA